ncbi:TetR/AcrR family transcriptional regulator [Kitasatospora acidiphila]|uniref:TetR/AcrR family transcriptional regulator n=1 Tax=Kitasatospora acidiphila TaxID=2567942 RepID=A0A540WG80_9ACTN|nr:TetR/AcrR family transcriptional regulator [Kitasatospora acidiphila]TQF08030.1 TetR/AcrR family transcriptional regulator [Kitasatospora acidiphila]
MARAQTTPKRPYAPRMPPAERREQLLDAALEIINTAGVAAVSVDSVARLAGVTRPVVYGQFTDSDHLLRDLLEREGERALAQLADVITTDPAGADPADTFTAVARGFYDAVLAHPARWRAILLPVDTSPAPVRRYKEATEADIRARFAEAVRRLLQDRPGGETVDVDLLAHVLLTTLEDGGRLLLRDPATYPPERLTDLARFLVETFLHRYRS